MILLLAAALVVVVSPPASKSSTDPHRGRTTTLNGWNSGVYPGDGIDLAAAASFSTYRGRRLDNIHVFPEASSWSEIGYDSWEVRQYAGFPRRLVIDTPLLPLSGGGTLAEVAAGQDDRYFRSMARTLVSLGRRDSVLVLGSEFNGNWQTYSAFDPPTFIAAFRHVAKLLKTISPDFQIDWTGNAIDNQGGHDPFAEDYPGDDVVDIIGVDAYDHDAGVAALGFDHWLNQPFGLAAWAHFARQHHKPFSVPEWGLTASAGDEAEYVDGMFRFFAANSGTLAFEDYFNEPRPTPRNSLNNPVEMPSSSALYHQLWSSLAPDPNRASLRLSPRTSTLKRGRDTSLRGRLRVVHGRVGHRIVRLYRYEPDGLHWSLVKKARTSRKGAFSFSIAPRTAADYRVILDGSPRQSATSPQAAVRVHR